MPEPAGPTGAAPGPLLSVKGLTVTVDGARGRTTIVDAVSFDVAVNERVAIVGESGSGKTMTALAIMRLTDQATISTQGEVRFGQADLAAASARELRALRGASIAYVPQDPMAALNPFFPVGYQLKAVLRSHQSTSRRAAQAAVIDMLGRVGIPNPRRTYEDYPHHLSGGMRQRCVIAAALICRPRLIIADEPTTALDVTIQAQIFDLLDTRAAEDGLALVLITHNLAIVSEICDRILTMYAGQIVEIGSSSAVESGAGGRHPYTRALLECAPSIQPSGAGAHLFEIPGESPSPGRWAHGCRFAPRCPMVRPRCSAEEQALLAVGAGDSVRCWRAVEDTATVPAAFAGPSSGADPDA